MRAVAIGATLLAPQVLDSVGCNDDPVEVRWESPAAVLGDDGFDIELHGCADWSVEQRGDHLEVVAGWTSCAVSGVVRDGALVVESEALPLSGDENVTLDFGLPTGPIGGMGAWVGRSCSGIVISDVQHGYPAEMAGLRRGDLVLTVNGEPTRRMGVRRFVRTATGAPGTYVELEVLSYGADEPRVVRLLRERIPE